MEMTRVLAIITARGGSKRIPGKNIRPFSGKPLLHWTIQAAQECRELFHDLILSTDDAEIAQSAEKAGLRVPYMRPAELATDTAGSLGVVQHATQWIENRDKVQMDWILILQPTSPLRTAEDIRTAIGMATQANSHCDSIVAVSELTVHPVFTKRIDAEGYLRSWSTEEKEGTRKQDAGPPAYARNGAVYLTRRDVLMNSNSLYGEKILPMMMPNERSVDIDTELDFRFAEFLQQQKQKGAIR